MRISKKLFAFILTLVMILGSTTVYAEGNDCNDKFTDVGEDHWAYEYVCLMTELGIINGYDDGSFRPNATVSRAEFAKMMVKTLNLDLDSPSTESFIDVEKSDWEYPYVETAKGYLTGFKTSLGLKFKPDNNAVREDMAVAIVKGLGIAPDASLSVLDDYTDEDEISADLRSYVATAIAEGIMIGSGGSFEPQGNLTRAEAATLLARLLVEEKIVLDDEVKIVVDDFNETNTTPKLSATKVDNEIVLEWTKVSSDNFKYYKVSISDDNDSPKYPTTGYHLPLSDVDNNRYVLESGMSIVVLHLRVAKIIMFLLLQFIIMAKQNTLLQM